MIKRSMSHLTNSWNIIPLAIHIDTGVIYTSPLEILEDIEHW